MRKIITSFFVSCVIANASGISDFADSVVQVKEGSGAYSTKERTILYGGGYTMKVPNLTLTPFSVQAPNIKAGCGGIDMVFGSLGFLDKEQFVKFAEGILVAAPGVAFDLALKTLCPSCAETLKSLQSMANQINGMSLDSCQAATALGNNALESALGDNTKEDLKNNTVNNFFDGVNKSQLKDANENVQKINNWLNGFGANTAKPKIFVYLNQNNFASASSERSFIKYHFKDVPYLSEFEVLSFLRSAVGDLYISSEASGDYATKLIFKDSLTHLEEYYVANNKQIVTNTHKLINRLMGSSSDTEAQIYDDNYVIGYATFNKGNLVTKFGDKVKVLTTKIVSRQQLTSDEIAFLGYFKFPIYRIFNALGNNQYTAQVLDESAEQLGSMLASQLIYELLIQASRVIQERENEFISYESVSKGMWVDDKETLRKHISNMAKEARYAANLSYDIYIKNYEQFLKTLRGNEVVQKAKELKQLAITRANPQMIEQLMFLQTITPKVK